MIRILDVLLSICALFFLFPILLLISLIILIFNGGPIFFVQPRVGLNKTLFSFVKFRSMVVDNGANMGDKKEYLELDILKLKKLRQEYKTTLVNDSRITKFGGFLRSTSLDELPQLFNILKGEMSFVGPRPDPPIQKADYTDLQWEKRCMVKPGLTGLAQVNGRSKIGHDNRIKNDLIWVDKHGVLLYFKILIKTPFVLFKNAN